MISKKNKVFYSVAYAVVLVVMLFAIGFSSYVLFIEKSDASMFNCKWGTCTEVGVSCSDPNASIKCECVGPILGCSPFVPIH
jgi:hypothetical protein